MTLKTVAVWEYQSNNRVDWIPYCADVCHQLERATCSNLTKLYLGDVDVNLSAYVINLPQREQRNSQTGTTRSIRRVLYTLARGSLGFTVGLGIRWQWLVDQFGHWCSYPTEIQHFIEEAYRRNLPEVDLELFSSRFPYLVNFASMSQVRKETGTSRPLKRTTTRSYPYAKSDPTYDSSDSSDSVFQEPLSNASKASSSSNRKAKHRLTRSSKKIAKTEPPPPPPTQPEASTSQPQQQQNSTNFGSKILSWVMSSISPTSSTSSDTSATTNKNSQRKTKRKTKNKSSQWSIGSKPVKVKNVEASVAGAELDVDSILEKFTSEVEQPPDEDCIICCDVLSAPSSYDDDETVVQLSKCDHAFHRACLKAMISSSNRKKLTYIQCPMCKVIHGRKIGNQPDGSMKYYGFDQSLPGFPDCKTICILYEFRGGIQGSDHPQPGKEYSSTGFPRLCYLPDNDEGRKILRLLCVAWQRRLTFTIGTSVTTGYSNVVTWNEIHHKTEFGSNFSGHGFPDPHYFDNVLLELASQGVMESDLENID